MFCMLKKKKYILLLFENITQIVKNKLFFQKLWHYLAANRLSALLRGITSKNNGDFYCLNYLHSFRAKHNSNHIKNYVKIKYLSNVIIPSEDTKI